MGNPIKQGDTVEVISGDDRGLRGTVQRVLPEKKRIKKGPPEKWQLEGWRVLVSGVNIVKKHQRPIRAGRRQVQPGIIEFEAPIDLSNVMLVCPRCDQRTRVGFGVQDGRKVRVCKKCGEAID